MHENATIICAETETKAIFDIVVKLQAKSGSGAGKSYEEILDEAAETILKAIPPPFEVEAVSMLYPLTYSESMNTVLVQELMRYNNVIRVIRKELPTMRRALKGLVVMSVELEATANAIFTQGIPPSWEAVAYPSLKALGAWTEELAERLGFLQRWIDNGIPVAFWVPGFFFPQAFFTGTLQNFARKYQLPIDTLSFDFNMLKEHAPDLPARPEDGCYIYGFYIEGARWNDETMTLDDSRPKQLYTLAPSMHLQPVQNRPSPTGGIYRCPVYKELRRAGTLSTTGHSTNFIMWMELPGGREDIKNNLELSDQAYWIRAGVAMFCALRY
jgi:dynein heavy chain